MNLWKSFFMSFFCLLSSCMQVVLVMYNNMKLDPKGCIEFITYMLDVENMPMFILNFFLMLLHIGAVIFILMIIYITIFPNCLDSMDIKKMK